jgi:hypothetical protein
MSKRSSFLSKYDKKTGFIIVKFGFKSFFVESHTLFISKYKKPSFGDFFFDKFN